MLKKVFLFICLLFLLFLVGCKKEEKEFYNINIDNVCVYIDEDNYLPIEKNSIVNYSDSIKIHNDINWKYVVKGVNDFDNLPIIECLYPDTFRYNIYFNGEIIKSSKIIENEYQKLNYKIEHKIFDSNVEYCVNSSGSFSIENQGDYKIEYFFIFRLNGVEIECSDSFDFKVI